nr:hypothetical protein [Curtanaerobium respiraculi]
MKCGLCDKACPMSLPV